MTEERKPPRGGDPWREGFAAGQAGWRENDNPYDSTTEGRAFMSWRSG